MLITMITQLAEAGSEPIWNSLEVMKLLVSALTPIAVLGFGFWFNRQLKQFEHLQWAHQKVIEKRIKIYEENVPQLNDLLCYFSFVGCWKELTPPDVVKVKRTLDRTMHVNAPLFPEIVSELYQKFIGLCYQSYTGWGKDATLRTQFERRKAAAKDGWKPSWEAHFATDNYPDPNEVRAAYAALVKGLAIELGIGLQRPHAPTGRAPVNIR
jgi:hypothetical protein